MASAGAPGRAGTANELLCRSQGGDNTPRGHLSDAFPFTDLPFTVRRQVYLLMGLPVGERVSLNAIPDTIPKSVAADMTEWFRSQKPPGAYGLHAKYSSRRGPGSGTTISSLLLVSKPICAEIRSIFFSENAIAISQHRWAGLQALEGIGPGAWQDLRELIVRLEPCDCPTPFCTGKGWISASRQSRLSDELRTFLAGGPYRNPKHHRPLSEHDANDKDTLLQWERICRGIAAHGRPGQLRILFSGAVEDMEMAQRIVRPLFLLPRPLDIQISLSAPPAESFERPKTSRALRNFAMDTALRILNGPPPDQPFRFMCLPTELQIRILKHTSLGHTGTLTAWPEGHGTAHRRRPLACLDLFKDLPYCSFLDGETTSPNRYLLPDRCKAFCRAHAAAFHKDCVVYPPTLSWCRVSRRFGELVRSVFYSDIRLAVFGYCMSSLPYHGYTADREDQCSPAEILTILRRHAARDSLRHFRRIDIVFPPMSQGYLTPARESWRLWTEAIEVLAARADLPNLVLEVCIPLYAADGLSDEQFNTQQMWSWRQLDEDHMEIIRCLDKLTGLKGLFVYLPWPGGAARAEERAAKERKLERAVMGESYDSRALRKPAKAVAYKPYRSLRHHRRLT